VVLRLGTEAEQGGGGGVPATAVTGGEVQGQGKTQGLTVVLLRHLSRAGVAGIVGLDEDPRWWRRGLRRRRGSGDQRRQRTCAREPVSHGERVGTTNWKDSCRI
jgi:hypothetical protein